MNRLIINERSFYCILNDNPWIPKHVVKLFACECAEHVLSLFEAKYPQDMRPRQAIALAREAIFDESKREEAKEAADAARATARAAYAAAYAAAGAAAGAAAYAAYAAYAASGAAAGAAAYAAADAAGNDYDEAWNKEFDWQVEKLKELIKLDNECFGVLEDKDD